VLKELTHAIFSTTDLTPGSANYAPVILISSAVSFLAVSRLVLFLVCSMSSADLPPPPSFSS
jgi:hypothetical protein